MAIAVSEVTKQLEKLPYDILQWLAQLISDLANRVQPREALEKAQRNLISGTQEALSVSAADVLIRARQAQEGTGPTGATGATGTGPTGPDTGDDTDTDSDDDSDTDPTEPAGYRRR